MASHYCWFFFIQSVVLVHILTLLEFSTISPLCRPVCYISVVKWCETLNKYIFNSRNKSQKINKKLTIHKLAEKWTLTKITTCCWRYCHSKDAYSLNNNTTNILNFLNLASSQYLKHHVDNSESARKYTVQKH